MSGNDFSESLYPSRNYGKTDMLNKLRREREDRLLTESLREGRTHNEHLEMEKRVLRKYHDFGGGFTEPQVSIMANLDSDITSINFSPEESKTMRVDIMATELVEDGIDREVLKRMGHVINRIATKAFKLGKDSKKNPEAVAYYLNKAIQRSK